MREFVVFGREGQFVTLADSWIRAIQNIVSVTDAPASAWRAADMSTMNPSLRARLIKESNHV